jgi:hypothetical protein
MYMSGVLPGYKHLFTDESKSYVANSALEYGFKYGFVNVLLFEKKGGADFSRVCMAGCMGRISHTNLKFVR